jgi:hypothetical protein
MKRVILNLIATNKYTFFLDGIIESARKMFANDCELNFIIYTDSDLISDSGDIKKIHTEGEPWPMPTLKRFHYFLLAENEIMESDFSFYIDVDSLFRNPLNISDIIKSEEGLIGTLHPGFIGSLGTPERNPNSTAYIPWNVNCPYFCGGFFGGDSRSFIDMAKYISGAIDLDLKNDIIAIWHDESHLNKYFNLIKKPSIILGDGFTAPEEYLNNKNPYIVFLDKRGNEEISKIKNKK